MAKKSMGLLPIMSPLYNMREVCKHMSLLEDHLNNPRKRCHDCIRKHFLTIEAFFEEAVSLDKKFQYSEYLDGKAQAIRDLQGTWIDCKDKKDHDREYLVISQELRAMRKGFAPICFDVRKMASLDRLSAVCPHGTMMREASVDREASLRSFFRDIPVIGGIIRLLSDGRTADVVLADKLTTLKQKLFNKLYAISKPIKGTDIQALARDGKKDILSEMRSYALDIKRDKVPMYKKFLKEFISKDITPELFKNPHHEKTLTAAFDVFKKTINKLPAGAELRFKDFPSNSQTLVLTDPLNMVFKLVSKKSLSLNPAELADETYKKEEKGWFSSLFGDSEKTITIDKVSIEGISCVALQTSTEYLLTIFNPNGLKNFISSTDRVVDFNTLRKQQEKELDTLKTQVHKTASFSSTVRVLKYFARKWGWSKFLLNLFAQDTPPNVLKKKFCEELGLAVIKHISKYSNPTSKEVNEFIISQVKDFNTAMASYRADYKALHDSGYGGYTHDYADITATACTTELTVSYKRYADTVLTPAFERLLAQFADKKMPGEEVVFNFYPQSKTETLLFKGKAGKELGFYLVLKDYMVDEIVKLRDTISISLVPATADFPAHILVRNIKGKDLAKVFTPEGLTPTLLGASDVDMTSLRSTISRKAFMAYATKNHFEREDDKIADLVKPSPKNKPPRYDLANRGISVDDPDLGGLGGGHLGDRDLSMKSNKAARLVARYAEEKKKP